jgi:hypothetical protein
MIQRLIRCEYAAFESNSCQRGLFGAHFVSSLKKNTKTTTAPFPLKLILVFSRASGKFAFPKTARFHYNPGARDNGTSRHALKRSIGEPELSRR